MINSTHKNKPEQYKKIKLTEHFSLIYHVASPKYDLDTLFHYINFIPIHKPMLILR